MWIYSRSIGYNTGKTYYIIWLSRLGLLLGLGIERIFIMISDYYSQKGEYIDCHGIPQEITLVNTLRCRNLHELYLKMRRAVLRIITTPHETKMYSLQGNVLQKVHKENKNSCPVGWGPPAHLYRMSLYPEKLEKPCLPPMNLSTEALCLWIKPRMFPLGVKLTHAPQIKLCTPQNRSLSRVVSVQCTVFK